MKLDSASFLAQIPPKTVNAMMATKDEFNPQRLNREWRTVKLLVRIYCRGRHRAGSSLCPECSSLLDYVELRLERCHFGPGKPTCANCPVHCYQQTRREQIKEVMRYAGPRMLWRHPILAVRHWMDGFRRVDSAQRGS